MIYSNFKFAIVKHLLIEISQMFIPEIRLTDPCKRPGFRFIFHLNAISFMSPACKITEKEMATEK
jgi:hypothetical protein